MKLVVEHREPGQFPVTVHQRADGLFKVEYGAEETDWVRYVDAARAFGQCVFHAVACTGKIVTSPGNGSPR